ncbi:nucleoside triphosphate pyrophosphohydrolase [Candidatus Kaiserbacteria bacterium]|nr:nucleoside triphosphate pyrophosphohydrolase [Candidatus Kaiserbacteria bacterium]
MAKISRVYYNKLIRDNVPDKIKAKGENFEVRPITDAQEFQQELFKKVREEAHAVSMARSAEDFLNEYCDLMMVLETIIDQLEIPHEKVKEARAENRLKKGKYDHKHFLVWSEDVDYKTEETPQGIPL